MLRVASVIEMLRVCDAVWYGTLGETEILSALDAARIDKVKRRVKRQMDGMVKVRSPRHDVSRHHRTMRIRGSRYAGGKAREEKDWVGEFFGRRGTQQIISRRRPSHAEA